MTKVAYGIGHQAHRHPGVGKIYRSRMREDILGIFQVAEDEYRHKIKLQEVGDTVGGAISMASESPSPGRESKKLANKKLRR